MNKVIKTAIGAFAAGVTLFAGVAFASAATISTPLFSNGQTSIDATGGSTVSGTFTLTVGAMEVCEWTRTQSDPSQPFVDLSVGGTLGYQEGVYVNVPFSVKAPPNTGTYSPMVQCAGAYGGSRAINGGDTVFPSVISLGSTGLGTVRVVANATTPSVTTTDKQPWEVAFEALTKKLSDLTDHIAKLGTVAPTPSSSAACTELALKSNGAIVGATSPANVKLQGFLLSEGASIPALAAGAAFGFYGPQTQTAVAWFKSVNGCI